MVDRGAKLWGTREFSTYAAKAVEARIVETGQVEGEKHEFWIQLTVSCFESIPSRAWVPTPRSSSLITVLRARPPRRRTPSVRLLPLRMRSVRRSSRAPSLELSRRQTASLRNSSPSFKSLSNFVSRVRLLTPSRRTWRVTGNNRSRTGDGSSTSKKRGNSGSSSFQLSVLELSGSLYS